MKPAATLLSIALCILTAMSVPVVGPVLQAGENISAYFESNRSRNVQRRSLAPQTTYFSQDFSSSTVVSSYVSATPNSGQFNGISSAGPDMTISINSGKLQFARTDANSGSYSRTTDFSPAPSTLKYSLSLGVSENSFNATTAAVFQVGSGFGTGSTEQLNANVHSRFGVNFTTTAGQWSLRNIGAGTNSSLFTGTQAVTWYINNSGNAISYIAPNGSIETLGNDAADVWVGNIRALNEISATTGTQPLTDLKFAFIGSTGTIQIDNINIEDIPPVPPLADYTNLQFPSTTTTNSGQTTEQIYGRIFEAGVTEAAGSSGSVTAQLGFGPLGSDPRTSPNWTYTAASFNAQVGNDDEYIATISAPSPPSTMQYAYTYRFSLDGGANWTYADLNGNGTNAGLSFDPAQLGTMTVNHIAPQPGTLSWTAANQSASEANTAQFTVQRTGGSDGTVTVDYGFQNVGSTGGAACTADVDYVNTGGTVEFLNGETSKQVNVQICNDSLYEGNESFNIILSGTTGGATLGSPSISQYQIEDNDIPSVAFASTNYAKREGATASVVITRTGATNATATVNYSISGGNASAGTCGTAGVDYVAPGGSVEFQTGETEKTISIQLCTDELGEDPDETIQLTLDSAISAEVGSPSTTTVTILDSLQQSLWVFGGSVVPNPVSTLNGRSRLIAQSLFAKVKELYVSVYQGTENSNGRRMYEDSDIAALNTLADAGGQEVWAAYGDSDWPALTAGCAGTSFPELRMAEVVAFNASRPANERFAGVMLDVESNPQTPEEFQALIAHYECMRSRLPSDIKLGVAISAFWDDDVVDYPAAGPASKPVSSHIIDLPLDRVVVMGYRDVAGTTGGNGIIGLDEAEITYANSVGKTGLIFAGLETMSLPGEDGVTFHEEGEAALETEAAIAANFFDSSLGLGGFAIHNYNASYLSGDAGWSTAPTAAPASISGRVMTANGVGIRGAVVTVQGLDGGVWSAATNTFGYYRIEGLTAGASYVVSVNARRYAFANGTQLISLADNISGLDFTASP